MRQNPETDFDFWGWFAVIMLLAALAVGLLMIFTR